MSTELDELAVATVNQDLMDAAQKRRYAEPTNPAEWLAGLMARKSASAEDVASKSNGLSVGAIRKLMSGIRVFTDEICGELSPWLGPKNSKTLIGIVKLYDYYRAHNERPPFQTVPDTPENRRVARLYARLKNG